MPSSKPTGYVTINNMKLVAFLMEIPLFDPSMALLVHIHIYVNNTAAQVWSNRDSVSTTFLVGPILRELALVMRRQHTHAST